MTTGSDGRYHRQQAAAAEREARRERWLAGRQWQQDDGGMPPAPSPEQPLKGHPEMHDEQRCARETLEMVAVGGMVVLPRDLRECMCLYQDPWMGTREMTDAENWNFVNTNARHLMSAEIDGQVQRHCQQALAEGWNPVPVARQLAASVALLHGPLPVSQDD